MFAQCFRFHICQWRTWEKIFKEGAAYSEKEVYIYINPHIGDFAGSNVYHNSHFENMFLFNWLSPKMLDVVHSNIAIVVSLYVKILSHFVFDNTVEI